MSRETVIRRIIKRESQKRGLTERAIRRESPALYRMACKDFGTWDTALKYAGIRLRRLYVDESYTQDHVIERLREYYLKNGRPMAASIMAHDRRLYEAARRHFGTWSKAIRAAGIPTEQLCLSKDRHCNDQEAGAKTMKDAGISRSQRYQKWSRQRIIEEILSRQQAGKSLHYKAVNDDQITLFYAAVRYFGSWNRALRAAGISVKLWTRLHVKPPKSNSIPPI